MKNPADDAYAMHKARVETLVVSEDGLGLRLDKWLTIALSDLDYAMSRSQVQSLIDEGRVTFQGSRPVKASDMVSPGTLYRVTIPEPEPMEIVPETLDFTIVHEDHHVVVVDKPRGLVVHPGAGNPSGTLVNGIVGRGIPLSSLGGALRPGVVHRIDKDTSGLIVFAKSDVAYHGLSEQLRQHTMDRVYLALVRGVLAEPRAVIDAPIGRDAHNRLRMAVVEGGKTALTHLFLLEQFERVAYVRLQLLTGRTHQIRVHMAYIGHPLVGDKVYAPAKRAPIDGQALHAATLGFIHPVTLDKLSFTSPLPEDMEGLLSGLRKRLRQEPYLDV